MKIVAQILIVLRSKKSRFFTIVWAGLLMLGSPSLYGYTFHKKGTTPQDLRHHGNSYSTNNPYQPQGPHDPYRAENSPYSNQSIYHHHSKQSQTIISDKVTNPNAINNPYGQKGNPFNDSHTDHPYRQNNNNNPYSNYQNPYHSKSARNNPDYRYHIPNEQGKNVDHSLSNSDQTNGSISNYQNSPYQGDHYDQPYP